MRDSTDGRPIRRGSGSCPDRSPALCRAPRPGSRILSGSVTGSLPPDPDWDWDREPEPEPDSRLDRRLAGPLIALLKPPLVSSQRTPHRVKHPVAPGPPRPIACIACVGMWCLPSRAMRHAASYARGIICPGHLAMMIGGLACRSRRRFRRGTRRGVAPRRRAPASSSARARRDLRPACNWAEPVLGAISAHVMSSPLSLIFVLISRRIDVLCASRRETSS